MTAGESIAVTAQMDYQPPSNVIAKPVTVLFVCLGNICRSTMAEGVFRHLAHPAGRPPHPLVGRIDSCGTGAYHEGDGPDPRTMSTLADHGITTYTHQARKFRTKDFTDFEYILAMDDDNLEHLQQLRRRYVKDNGGDESGVGQVCLFGDFGGKKRRNGKGEEVQDPYYGGRDGFEIAYEQSVKFSKAFLEKLDNGEI